LVNRLELLPAIEGVVPNLNPQPVPDQLIKLSMLLTVVRLNAEQKPVKVRFQKILSTQGKGGRPDRQTIADLVDSSLVKRSELFAI